MRLFALMLVLGLPATAHAQAAADRHDYAQPSTPLGEALERFAKKSGIDVIFPESMVRGRRSGVVEATDNPHRALQMILAESGLVARFIRRDAIVLEAARGNEAPDMTLDLLRVGAPTARQASAYQWYGQRLLEASLDQLRGATGLSRRSFDLFVYLWVDAEGRVTDSRVYGEGGAQREAGLASAALEKIALHLPPPSDMPQPVGIRIAAQ